MEYTELEQLIDTLQSAVENKDPQKGYWKELWALVNEIRIGIRQTQFPTAVKKQYAKCRFNELISIARARSEQEILALEEQRQRIREESKAKSQTLLNRMQSKISDALPVTDPEQTDGALGLDLSLVLEGMSQSAFSIEQLDEIHENLKVYSANLQNAWGMFNNNKLDLLPEDRNAAYQQLTAAKKQLNTAWDVWRREKKRVHHEQQSAWEELRRERETKRKDFVRNVEANIEKLEEKIQKAENALERQKIHRANLDEKYANAWNNSFKERCGNWIDETDNRIQNIEASIERMKGWLEEERAKLRR